MTRSEMIKMLKNAASALKGLPKTALDKAADSPPVNQQLKVDVLQVILQILQAILADQGQQKAGEVSADDADLLNAVVSILDSIKEDQASTPVPNVQVGGLQIEVLQLIIQIITAVWSQQKAPAVMESGEEGQFRSEAVHPLLTSDSIAYTYDTLGRLKTLTYTSGHVITFNYDATGNRTSTVTT